MSPVSSVESWFFSSFGWNVPMPTRSFSLKTRRFTRTWFDTIFAQSPSYFSIRALKMKRLAGSMSPSTRTLNLSFESPSCAIAFARQSGGMIRSGSSFIALGKRSTSWFSIPVPARFDPLEGVERAVRRA